ncbi:hypothetical protein F4805DRAFT_462193 [Annulohypoxylon moriforme]|nr:hypothetical protein F4805DRAFT_462193 [Annulohypoxylon moriforme]
MIQRTKSRGVLHIPLKARLPLEQPEVASPSQIADLAWLWGYWVVGRKRSPIVKSRQRPPDENLLKSSRIQMPLRFAAYSKGIPGRWQYDFTERWGLATRADELKQQYGQSLVVQVLFKDIFSVLFAVERRVLYDPVCLELLDDREWTSPYFEPTGKLNLFEKALRKYNKRIQTGGFNSGLERALSKGAEPRDWNGVLGNDDNEDVYDDDGEPLRRPRSW